MKKYLNGKRFLALLALMVLCFTSVAVAAPSRGELLRFIPTVITVESDSVTVEGYFLNLNEDCDIKNLKEVDMDVYEGETHLVSGNFGDINQFTIKSMGLKYQSFTFNGEHDLNEGVYNCNDRFYVAFSCSFTSVSK